MDASMLRWRQSRVLTRNSEEIMSRIEPSILNQLQLFAPPCPRCGSDTKLTRIEPAEPPGHDLRSFECRGCHATQVLTVKYRD